MITKSPLKRMGLSGSSESSWNTRMLLWQLFAIITVWFCVSNTEICAQDDPVEQNPSPNQEDNLFEDETTEAELSEEQTTLEDENDPATPESYAETKIPTLDEKEISEDEKQFVQQLDKSAEAHAKPNKNVKSDFDDYKETKSESPISLDFVALMPMGKSCYDVSIPQLKTGQLVSLMRAKEMRRISDEHLFVKNLYIERYDSFGEVSLTIFMENAFYIFKQDVIFSNQETTIKSPRYIVRGEGIVYEISTQRGKLFGKTEMLVQD